MCETHILRPTLPYMRIACESCQKSGSSGKQSFGEDGAGAGRKARVVRVCEESPPTSSLSGLK